MSTPWRSFIERSARVLRDNSASVISMSGAFRSGEPKLLFRYRSPQEIGQHVTGCDSDLGGSSTAMLDISPEDGRGRFSGVVSTNVPRLKDGSVVGGYAGFRNRARTSLFGAITDDLELHNYLALRVRAAGDPRTRTAYFVNVQTEGPDPPDLWQHRLYLNKEDQSPNGVWETVLIPFNSFELASVDDAPSGQNMSRHRIRSIGISVLGGRAKISGTYELGIDYIAAINEPEDASRLDALADGGEPSGAS
ncbi:complex I intermediate-associated protein CIA30 [Cantharellus anzutake]|uniref:complex I intermediate-associated protein CIA30 n=1 Tax=Cantharellus anzutake TaxID=1750568 RepID=UPI001907BA10|nr:complex I intermediate-associated protein CIA30 [Cantharellus anzutake]KAF8326562.1 complex I intermediate-associated protein CIA30 [Cantharellus anzutake]